MAGGRALERLRAAVVFTAPFLYACPGATRLHLHPLASSRPPFSALKCNGNRTRAAEKLHLVCAMKKIKTCTQGLRRVGLFFFIRPSSGASFPSLLTLRSASVGILLPRAPFDLSWVSFRRFGLTSLSLPVRICTGAFFGAFWLFFFLPCM